MKKAGSALVLICVVCIAFANGPVNEKLDGIFKASFPNAKDVVWTEFENFYQVYFVKDGASCRVYYDYNGNVMRSRRDYAGEKLTPFLTAKLTKKYPGKTVHLVTEINSESECFYIVTMQDAKQMVQVRCESDGAISTLDTMQKE